MLRWLFWGSDPYHDRERSAGLSFGTDDIPARLLQNILKELADDIGVKESHDLTLGSK